MFPPLPYSVFVFVYIIYKNVEIMSFAYSAKKSPNVKFEFWLFNLQWLQSYDDFELAELPDAFFSFFFSFFYAFP